MNDDLRKGVRTWIEVDTRALEKNIKLFRSIIDPSVKLCAVVKSNAYGHGLVGFSQVVDKIGVDMLAVDSITEALRLRREAISSPILVLGYTLPEMLTRACDDNIAITVSTYETLRLIPRLCKGKKVKVHIKVDTGMHRQGFLLADTDIVISYLKDHSNVIEFAGLYTHFASAKNPVFSDSTRAQIREFNEWCEKAKKAGFNPICHASATSGTILYPEAHFDMVRIGIGLYGLWPSIETRSYAEKRVPLEPILSWRTIVSEVKTLPKGSRIGYDFTEILNREKNTIAICPIGYWHGYPRALSGIGHVLIKGKRVKIIGRVSMDMIAIDITDIKKVGVGDAVTLVGEDKREKVPIEELAYITDSSWYEVVTRINPLILKIYI